MTKEVTRKEEMDKNLQSVFVTLRSSKLFGYIPKLRNGNRVPLEDPFLKNVGGASLWEPQPQDSAP